MKFEKETLEGLLKRAESEGIFNKAVAGFILPDGRREILTLNTPKNTVFDIASLTKVCPTSTLALSYILEGKLSVDTKVIDFIPELQTNYREDIRVFHLLTHSLDYRVPMKTLRTLPAEGILNALYTYQFEKAPGADFNYGNPASVLLGIILQRLMGKDLQQQGRERFFIPLGMTRSGWDPLTRDWNPIPKAEISPTEICSFRGREIQGEIHDESAWVLRKLFPVGSAGMFSCVPDLLNFVQMILNDGVIANGCGGECARVAPAGILKMVSENAFALDSASKYSTAKDACTALGWELSNAKFMGTKISPRTFGKTGFTGASIVADPDKGAAVVLLSNFTYPHREANADRIHAFRASLSDAFFG
ncbi:serine hydrolase [Fibrobacter sp. UWB1]|uniref:serine hydrolase domain-containing protein n=1 Tax=Fibrobacter sp. UWB1 TaxID=1964355 RepID=UPI000B520F5E|nr:serine hydrolase domain-containing protein [Fibrobacter sp. UWB1]OWV25315.1 serine hydrolase [Fibrobacter sp. UWB1]